MSDRLKQGMESSRKQIELGLVEAEDELSAVQRRCHELEDMISLGKAIFIAAEMQVGHDLTAVSALEAAQAQESVPESDAPDEPTIVEPVPEDPRILDPLPDRTVETPRPEPVGSREIAATVAQPSAGSVTSTAVAEAPEFPMALDLAARLTGETVMPPAYGDVESYVGSEPVADRPAIDEPTLAQLLVGMGSVPASADPAPTEEPSEYLMADLAPAEDGSVLVEIADAEKTRRMTTLAARLAGGHIRLTNADLERSAADLAERLRNATVARTVAS